MHWRCDWNLCLDGDYRLERGTNTPQNNHMSKWKITILPGAVGKGVWSPQRLWSRWGLSYLGQGLNRPSPQESISGRGADQCKGPVAEGTRWIWELKGGPWGWGVETEEEFVSWAGARGRQHLADVFRSLVSIWRAMGAVSWRIV